MSGTDSSSESSGEPAGGGWSPLPGAWTLVAWRGEYFMRPAKFFLSSDGVRDILSTVENTRGLWGAHK